MRMLIPKRHQVAQATLSLSALIIITSTLSGCGQSDVVYSGTSPGVTAQSTSNYTLPNGIYDLSVNNANVTIVSSAITATNLNYLQLKTVSGSNPVGAFNGNGQGSRAIVGFAVSSGLPLSDFTGVQFSAQSIHGARLPEVLLNVDLYCDTTVQKVLIAEQGALSAGQSSIAGSGGFYQLNARISDIVWLARGSDILDSSSNSVVLPGDSNSSPTYHSLASLKSAYPHACLRNGVYTDLSLPVSVELTAVMLTLGDQNTTDANTVLIDSVTVGDDIYDQWGTP